MSAAIDTLNSSQQEEYRRIMHNACSMPGFNTTTTRPLAKALLLQDWIFCQGEGRQFKVVHKGLGVFHVSTERRP